MAIDFNDFRIVKHTDANGECETYLVSPEVFEMLLFQYEENARNGLQGYETLMDIIYNQLNPGEDYLPVDELDVDLYIDYDGFDFELENLAYDLGIIDDGYEDDDEGYGW